MGPWSPQEDELLIGLVEENGPKNCSTISNSIPGRSGKSCRLRWCNHLSPMVALRTFSPHEDKVDTALDGYGLMLMPESPYPVLVNERDTTLSLSLPSSGSGCFSGVVPSDLDLVGSGEVQMHEADFAPPPPPPESRVWSQTEAMEEYIDRIGIGRTSCGGASQKPVDDVFSRGVTGAE